MNPDSPEPMPEVRPGIVFESPLNERVRLYLRLEFLFAQYHHHRTDGSHWGVRASLNALLDILSLVGGRSELKNEIIKELGAQHTALQKLKESPGVDPERLNRVLDELGVAIKAMQRLTLQATGTGLRENAFLMMLANRSTVPGGTSGFDLPNFHAWLAQPAEVHRRDLGAWFTDLTPYEHAIGLYLRLLRDSTEPTSETATGGIFVHNPAAQFQLVRIRVEPTLNLYPEVSGGGRYRFTVRFLTLRDINQHALQATQDVPFQLQLCLL